MKVKTKKKQLEEVMEVISLLKTKEEAEAFFTDLCTPAELDAMASRWQVVLLLKKELPYRTIHEKTAASVTTITRVARFLQLGSGGYDLIFNRQEKL